MAGVGPGRPVLVTVNTACILEGDSKGGGSVGFSEKGHTVAPCGIRDSVGVMCNGGLVSRCTWSFWIHDVFGACLVVLLTCLAVWEAVDDCFVFLLLVSLFSQSLL